MVRGGEITTVHKRGFWEADSLQSRARLDARPRATRGMASISITVGQGCLGRCYQLYKASENHRISRVIFNCPNDVKRGNTEKAHRLLPTWLAEVGACRKA